jgi:hypothetical protein
MLLGLGLGKARIPFGSDRSFWGCRSRCGETALGLVGPVPARVDATAKRALLALLEQAVAGGWTLRRSCRVLGLDPRPCAALAGAGRCPRA